MLTTRARYRSMRPPEDEVLSSPQAETVEKIHSVKRRLLALRRAIGPHREAINALLQSGCKTD